jgi:hypothetical protein
MSPNKDRKPLGWCRDCDGSGEQYINDHPSQSPEHDESHNCHECAGTGIRGNAWGVAGLPFGAARYDLVKWGADR